MAAVRLVLCVSHLFVHVEPPRFAAALVQRTTINMKYACCKSLAEGAVSALICIKCKQNHHVACVFPSDKKKVTNEFRKSWLCPDCSLAQPKVLRNDNTPLTPQQGGNPRCQPSGIDNVNSRRGGSCGESPPPTPQNLSSSCLSLDSIKDMISKEISVMISKEIATLKSEIDRTITKAVSRELKPLREEIASIKESLNFINNQHDLIVKRVDNLEKEVKLVSVAKAEVGKIRDAISIADAENHKREQWARRSNVEIFGIPERQGENLLKILGDIASHMQFPLHSASDIDFVTRVAPKQNENKKIKPIVVRFLARWKKDDFLAVARKLRLKCSDIGISGDSFVHFNEHLTSRNKALLQRVKSVCKEKGFKYVWVRNCSIKVRRSDTSPVIHISCESDLNKIK